ncbi:MAG: hypothetical protein JXQ96_08055 [Cyclobacteriaceae bacterium]
MKKIIVIVFIMIASMTHVVANGLYTQRTDTLIIDLGNNSKLIIFVDSQEDLKAIEEFDINEMIREINKSIEASGNVGEVEITDDTGERFLKDTVVTVDRRKQVQEPVEEIPVEEPEVMPVAEAPTPVAEPAVKVMDLKDLGKSDTINAVLSNGEQVRLTFSQEQVQKPKKRRKQDYRTSRLSHNYFAVDFGLNNWLEDGQLPSGEDKLYTIKPVGSWYAGGRYFRRIAIGGPIFVDFGGSATWYSWKFENKSVRILKDADHVEFVEDLGIDGIKSKLSASYINIEIIPTFDFSYGKARVDDPEAKRRRYTKHVRPNGFRIGIGGYAGYRMDSWTKNVYNDANGDEKKDKEGSTFFLNNLRYGARVQIELDYDFSLFCNYDLNTVFVENKGPKLNAVSFGVTMEL